MDVLLSQQTEIARIQGVLPGVIKTLLGAHHMDHYLGNGKDGFVFKMHNPADPADKSFDRYAIKMWEKGFCFRRKEVDLQQEAFLAESRVFRTPQVILADPKSDFFVMDRVMGESVYQAVFLNKRLISTSLFEAMCSAFDSLNRSGIRHGDAHPGNYMLTDLQLVDTPAGKVIDDADLWIIDFGRAAHGHGNDSSVIRRDLKNKIASETP